MTNKRRTALLFVLATAAASMARFFDAPDPWVALAALAAWCCLLVAIVKARRP